MDAKEIRNLQEAYLEVVINEGLGGAKNESDEERLNNRLRDIENSTENSIEKLKQGKARWQQQRKADQAQEFLKKHPRKKRTQREEVDLYDIILSHLLDEGYAETYEAAEKIMVNMSEEWRESIFEAMVNPFEQKPSHRRGEPPTISPIQRAQNTVRELQRKDPNSPKTRRVTRQINDIERLYGFARNAPGARR